MAVHRTDRATLGEALAHVLREADIDRAAVSVEDGALEVVVLNALSDAGGRPVVSNDEGGSGCLFDATCGITDVVGAVAETGSIVCGSGPRSSRGAFIVPPVHVAIVKVAQLVPDLADAFQSMADGRWSLDRSAVVIVSGPSKTADIEGVLVTGVHGPGQVHVMLVDGRLPDTGPTEPRTA
ncbi:MAG: lactate utilization protein [Phycisphaerales bacterium]|nr:lactate utilization protein [Phycisphaerales bacterium]